MKPWNSKDQFAVQSIMRQQTANYRTVYLCFPSKTAGTGYDEFTDSSGEITDGKPTGQTITWLVQPIQARIASPTFTELVVNNGNGYQIGDSKLFFKATDYDSVNRIVGEKDGFISIDGIAYRPFSGVNVAGLYHADERYVSIRATTPRVRPTGY